MLERWDKLDDIDVEQLMEFVQGPDFPTGGIIIEEKGDEGIESAYGSGRGRITVQAKAHIEEMERSKSRIIVTELPYMVNKSSLIERIAELARDGHLEGLSDLRDESDRQGMRIVLEMTKNAEPESVLRELYKRTPMQTTFSINLLALVDGEPRTLTLKQALRVYLDHRVTVINECCRALRRGGGILCFNHDVQALSARLLGERSPIIDIEHTYLYSKATIRKIFQAHGFIVREISSGTNIYTLRYLFQLLPIPEKIKGAFLSLLPNLSIGRMKLQVRLGNLYLVAQKA